MRHLTKAVVLSTFWFATGSGAGFAMSPQELCTRVFEQYGIRSEDCGAEAAPDPAPPRQEPSAEMRENHVFFAQGGVGLDAQAQAQLAMLIEVLETPLMGNACLRLVGHSDSSGAEDRNHHLALQRASVVAERLRDGLTDGSRVREVDAEGEARPLPGFDGRAAANRRVEILARSCD